MSQHPNYRTGKSHDALGYVTLTAGEHRGRREHRVVAERLLGRRLTVDELVHHINGDKTDNRPDNLELLSRASHPRIHLGRGREIACRACGRAKWHSPAAEARLSPRGYACLPCGGRWA